MICKLFAIYNAKRENYSADQLVGSATSVKNNLSSIMANTTTDESPQLMGEAGQLVTLSVVLFISFLGMSLLIFLLYSRKDI